MTSYVFSGASLVTRQLQCIADAYDSVSADRLWRIGIQHGWRCLEIGAGNGSIARLMADQVGATGHVDATDIDIDQVAAVDRRNLVVRRHDITADPLPDCEYDLIHARLVLMHLSERYELVARLWSALKPGGWLLTEDFDVRRRPLAMAAPDPAAAALYDRITLALAQATSAAGVDNGWGSHAYAAYRRAGFVGVTAESYARATPAGSPGYDLLAVYTRQLREPLLSTGAVTAADLDRFLLLVDDPEFVQQTPPLVGTWGQRPAQAA
jgi:SAM-dependent methyltransferase